MKKILVPCDFSRRSNEAFKVAVDIAEKTKGEIIVLYVIFNPVIYDVNYIGEPMLYNSSFIPDMEADAKKSFETMTKDLRKDAPKATLQVEMGGVLESIRSLIEKKDIDMVIMGTNGASGLEELVIGSNTEKVVRYSPVPVLVVREAFTTAMVRNILLPTTLSLNEDNFISKLKELQEFFGAALHILLINTPTHFQRDVEAIQAMEEFAKHYQLKHYKLHFKSYGTEEEGIIQFTHHQSIDLIAMGTHARKGIAHLFNVSVTEDVVNHIESPVWTYHLKKKN